VLLYLFAIAAGLASAVQAACTGALVRGLHNPYLVVLVSLVGSICVIAVAAAVASGLGWGRAEAASVP